MLIVKQVTPSGEQYVMETPYVNYVPREVKKCSPAENSLWRYDVDGTAYEMTGGTCYVMNQDGKTVATYRLSTNEDDRPKK